MQCKKCRKEIPENSIYCLYCGKKQMAEPAKKAKKRANGAGSIYKLPGRRRTPGAAAVTTYKNNVRNTVIIGYYGTEREAAFALANTDVKRISPEFNSTLEDVYNIWSRTHFKDLNESSVVGYEVAWKHLESCRNKKMRDIKADDFQCVIDNLIEKGRSRSTCNKIRILANQLSKCAMEHDIIQKNYAQFIKLPRTDKTKEKEIFSKKEIEILFQHKDDTTAQIILTLIYSGMRIGELFGIENKNVYLDKSYMIGGEKTEAGINRIIPIHQKILPFIRKWYSDKNIYLIPNSKGGMKNIRNFREREFYPFLESIGILSKDNHRLTPHSTRHTFASMMVQSNAKPELLQKVIGHENYETTVDFYTHFTKEDIDEMVEQVNAI